MITSQDKITDQRNNRVSILINLENLRIKKDFKTNNLFKLKNNCIKKQK